MLYGENMIQSESLFRWCLNLKDVEPQNESPIEQDIVASINTIISSLKKVTTESSGKISIRLMENLMNQAFFDRCLKYRDYGIRIANYFECFVTCSDNKTQKRLIRGYGDEELEVGCINLFCDAENQEKIRIGMIGEKSDLLWSVYFPSFVVGFYEGIPNHTLSNHKEVMSLQLWNTENMSDEELDDYVNRVLVEVSTMLNLKLRIIAPDDMWKKQGEAGEYSLTISDKRYSAIPLQYLEYGLNANNNRMCYLHLYQVVEYFFVHAQNYAFKRSLVESTTANIESLDDKKLHLILRKYINNRNEAASLKIVIKRSIDASWVRNYIKSDEKLIGQYTSNPYGEMGIVLNLDSNDDKLLDRLSNRIYFFRCAIAHAKGDTNEYIVLPSLHNDDIEKELPLMREIAKRVIDTWSES